ncbi:hypothetical protein [Chryseobacterium defluvii]|uniref:Uncharacterized protein n=1 Tax=Chryseobacterium defluvii TaxID=160396 RepID=A0A495SEA6_9FLAO|nr:hypothetical protein [Chryseobacterium defluvii]RKS97853.1 hypothetical protein BCF58_1987 [Chryseobacterium defluvii]
MKNILCLLTLFLLFNCNKYEEKNDRIKKVDTLAIDTNTLDINDQKSNDELNKMILSNDTIIYKKYRRKYMTSGHSKEFIYYAILMAEKNNYAEAYRDIADILDFALDDPLAYNSQYASYCLLKAYEMKSQRAISSVNYVYTEKGKKIPSSSSIYCNK